MLFQNAPQRGNGRGLGMLHLRIQPFDLTLRALEDFVGERAGKADHQVRSSELVLKASRRLDEYLRVALVLSAQVLVLPFHAFVSSQYDHTHIDPPSEALGAYKIQHICVSFSVCFLSAKSYIRLTTAF